MPRKFLTDEIRQRIIARQPDLAGYEFTSDNYLKFLVEELKPFIDATYRTLPGAEDTFVMGSSMGGLISAYAVAEYPDVFGGAACMSTDWNVAEGAFAGWLENHLPDAGSHRIYFDHGTETYDASYGPYQLEMDAVMRNRAIGTVRTGSPGGSKAPTTRLGHGASGCTFHWSFCSAHRSPEGTGERDARTGHGGRCGGC